MNPEFQRNLWLEASPRRLAWAGVVLLLIYGATVMATRTDPYGPLPVLGGSRVAARLPCRDMERQRRFGHMGHCSHGAGTIWRSAHLGATRSDNSAQPG